MGVNASRQAVKGQVKRLQQQQRDHLCPEPWGSATTARCQLSASGKGMVAVGIGEAGFEVGEMGVGATRVAAGIALSFVVGVGSV